MAFCLLIGAGTITSFISYAEDEDCIIMYRMYNPNSGQHLITTNANEAADLEKLFSETKKDAPCISITTEGEAKVRSKDKYTACVVDVFNCDDQFKLSAAGGIKVRGNSTADQGDEKPYRLKFEEKHNMLGLHDGNEYKSWVLLRSYWNFAPDYTAFNLAKAIFDGKEDIATYHVKGSQINKQFAAECGLPYHSGGG